MAIQNYICKLHFSIKVKHWGWGIMKSLQSWQRTKCINLETIHLLRILKFIFPWKLQHSSTSSQSIVLTFWILQGDVCFNSHSDVLLTLDQFEGTACVNVRTPWWWHPGRAKTCRRGNCVSNVFTSQCIENLLSRSNFASYTVCYNIHNNFVFIQ